MTPNNSLNRTHCSMQPKARHFILGLWPRTATVRLGQTLDITGNALPTRSLNLWCAASAALAAAAGAWLALDSVQFLIEQFRLAATMGILVSSVGLLVASVLLVGRPCAGKILAAACATGAAHFVVGYLSDMGNVSLGRALAQATCPSVVAVCFPQAAAFIDATALPAIGLVASSASISLASKRDA